MCHDRRAKVVGGFAVVAVLLVVAQSTNGGGWRASFAAANTDNCTHFLQIGNGWWSGTVGGAGNQRECIINAALVAHSTGLCLVQPETWAIYHPDLERGVHGRTDYVSPFNDRRVWHDFPTMFQPAAFIQGMKRFGVVVQPKSVALKDARIEWADFTLRLNELPGKDRGKHGAQQQLRDRYTQQWAKLDGVKTVFKYDTCYSGFGVSR